jgi:hypothetical protein
MPLAKNWFGKQPASIKIFLLLTFFVLLTILITFSCQAKNTDRRPSLLNSKRFKVGTTTGGRDWEYTVNHYKCEYALENQHTRVSAHSGMKFLIVSLTLKNKTKDVIHIFPELFDFKVHVAGDTFKEYQGSDVLEVMQDYYGDIGDISPAESVIGNVIFEIPDYASEITFEIGCENFKWELESK